MESITITLPRKMHLSVRISETGMRIRDWLQAIGGKFSNEKYRLRLTGWDLKNNEYHYHFTLIYGESSAAGTKERAAGADIEDYGGPATDPQAEGTQTDFSPDS